MEIFGWVAATILIFNVIFFSILWLIYWINDYKDYKEIRRKQRRE